MSASDPSETDAANSRRFTSFADTTIWVLSRRMTAAERRSASTITMIARSRKAVAMAFGTHGARAVPRTA